MTTNLAITIGSENKKTGPIPVVMADRWSCPTTCPLMNQGCYAEGGNMRIHWERHSAPEARHRTEETLELIEKLPLNQLWRYAVAGDLPGRGDTISEYQLKRLVRANGPRHGYTYTHKPVLPKKGRKPSKLHLNNRRLIKWANDEGFTVNLSASTLSEADDLFDLKIAPVVAIAPALDDDWWLQWDARPFTPKGRPCIVCPESCGFEVTCSTCGLCQLPNFNDIILFPAHGSKANAVSKLAKGQRK